MWLWIKEIKISFSTMPNKAPTPLHMVGCLCCFPKNAWENQPLLIIYSILLFFKSMFLSVYNNPKGYSWLEKKNHIKMIKPLSKI